MARKHHVKHNRSKSNYPKRLRARGESSSSVRMRWTGEPTEQITRDLMRMRDNDRARKTPG